MTPSRVRFSLPEPVRKKYYFIWQGPTWSAGRRAAAKGARIAVPPFLDCRSLVFHVRGDWIIYAPYKQNLLRVSPCLPALHILRAYRGDADKTDIITVKMQCLQLPLFLRLLLLLLLLYGVGLYARTDSPPEGTSLLFGPGGMNAREIPVGNAPAEDFH